MAYPYNTYPQYFPQNYPQYSTMPQQVNQQANQPTQQIQNGGFIPVPNIEVARSYHVAPGTSVTFIDENAPYVYTKTRGFSQFEPPVFEKLRLVKEEDAPQTPQIAQNTASTDKQVNSIEYATKAEIEALRDAQAVLQNEIDKIKESMGDKDDE